MRLFESFLPPCNTYSQEAGLPSRSFNLSLPFIIILSFLVSYKTLQVNIFDVAEEGCSDTKKRRSSVQSGNTYTVEITIQETSNYFMCDLAYCRVFVGDELATCQRFGSPLFGNVFRRKGKYPHILFIAVAVSTPWDVAPSSNLSGCR